MKKVLIILMIVAIMLSSVACGNITVPDDTLSTNNNSDVNNTNGQTTNVSATADVVIESCKFQKKIIAIDKECSTTEYSERTGKIYVDTVLWITNNTKEINENSFKAYVIYDELRYDMNYCLESYTCVGVNNDSIPVMSTASGGRVHLFASLPEEALNNENLTVNFSLFNKEYNCTVQDYEEIIDPLSFKTELKKGDRESLLGGAVTFEVVDCKYTKYLQASDTANTKQYSGTQPFVDCILKVTNNTDQVIGDIFAYTRIDGQNTRADIKIETENNTDLAYLSSKGLSPNQSEYIHICARVDESVPSEERIMRFNFGGNCYYIKAN